MNLDTTTKPDVSVIVVTLVGQTYLQRCLEALTRQEEAPAFEVIVPCDQSLGDVSGLQGKYPKVLFLPVNGRCTYAELRTLGIQQARADILAITEDHCLPVPTWCKHIWQAHQSLPHAAIGGPVEKKIPDAPLNWAIYFADYLRYMPPMGEGPTHQLTDLNVTYKRSALEPIAEVWAKEFHENAVHGALEARGQTLWMSPKVLVHQQRGMTLRHALWDRYAFGRLFASTRVQMVSLPRRLIFTASSVLIPFLLTLRVVGLMRWKRRWQGEFWRALPLIFLVNATWALGEFIGYITGSSRVVK